MPFSITKKRKREQMEEDEEIKEEMDQEPAPQAEGGEAGVTVVKKGRFTIKMKNNSQPSAKRRFTLRKAAEQQSWGNFGGDRLKFTPYRGCRCLAPFLDPDNMCAAVVASVDNETGKATVRWNEAKKNDPDKPEQNVVDLSSIRPPNTGSSNPLRTAGMGRQSTSMMARGEVLQDCAEKNEVSLRPTKQDICWEVGFGEVEEVDSGVVTVHLSKPDEDGEERAVVNIEDVAPRQYGDCLMLPRVLLPTAPRKKYMPTVKTPYVEKGLHFGQRKLLLSEIEFINRFLSSRIPTMKEEEDMQEEESSTNNVVVVYAGAADGSHLPYLGQLFPSVKFILYDPTPFDQSVLQAQQDRPEQFLRVESKYFTDAIAAEICREYPDTEWDRLLVSDIRSVNSHQVPTIRDVAEGIMRDNRLQQSWPGKLQAAQSMLKFHPPYPNYQGAPESIPYFAGRCYYGIWAPKSSTEVRLVVRREDLDEEEDDYDLKEFEEQMYHFNTEDRYSKDVCGEFTVLFEYVSREYPEKQYRELVQATLDLSAEISNQLGTPWFTPLTQEENLVRGLYADLKAGGTR